MPGSPIDIDFIDDQIAAIRENLRELIDLATAYAMDDNLTAQRIADEEARLALLIKRRDDLFEKLSTTRGEPK
jgi:hypothetical protein